MNNYEKIKQMSVDEMASFLINEDCDLDTPCEKCKNDAYCSCSTKEEFKQWLLQEWIN